ncbi:MMPL family transporter [Arthrobacter oryzae]|uniref:MMPL family transporter n=1 Tax=Arthrobacter oryzae TaxID=409290 RepID=UPI00286352F9|nr:MMPL family transporter [Arthrobacter oryzae]MDR6505789.1 hypothetical protein [Arthrobacter oryzae]
MRNTSVEDPNQLRPAPASASSKPTAQLAAVRAANPHAGRAPAAVEKAAGAESRPAWWGLVLILWAMVLAGLGVGAATLSGPVSNSVSIPGTESQRALDLLSSRTGANADSAIARVVFAAADGTTLATPSAKEAVQTAVKNLSELPNVRAVADPFVSRTVSADGRTAFAMGRGWSLPRP